MLPEHFETEEFGQGDVHKDAIEHQFEYLVDELLEHAATVDAGLLQPMLVDELDSDDRAQLVAQVVQLFESIVVHVLPPHDHCALHIPAVLVVRTAARPAATAPAVAIFHRADALRCCSYWRGGCAHGEGGDTREVPDDVL